MPAVAFTLKSADQEFKFETVTVERRAPQPFPYVSGDEKCKDLVTTTTGAELCARYVSWVTHNDDEDKKPWMYWIITRKELIKFSAIPLNLLRHFHDTMTPEALRGSNGEALCDHRYFEKRQVAAKRQPRTPAPKRKPWQVAPEAPTEDLMETNSVTAWTLKSKVAAQLIILTTRSPLNIVLDDKTFRMMWSAFRTVARYALQPILPCGQVLADELSELRTHMNPPVYGLATLALKRAKRRAPRTIFFALGSFSRLLTSHSIRLEDVEMDCAGTRCAWSNAPIPKGTCCLRLSVFHRIKRKTHRYHIVDTDFDARSWICTIFDCVQWPVLVAHGVVAWVETHNKFGASITADMRLRKFLEPGSGIDKMAELMTAHIVKMEFIKQRLLCF